MGWAFPGFDSFPVPLQVQIPDIAAYSGQQIGQVAAFFFPPGRGIFLPVDVLGHLDLDGMDPLAWLLLVPGLVAAAKGIIQSALPPSMDADGLNNALGDVSDAKKA